MQSSPSFGCIAAAFLLTCLLQLLPLPCTVSFVAKFALHVRVVFSQLTRNSTNCLIRTPAPTPSPTTVPVPVGAATTTTTAAGAGAGAEARLFRALHNLFVNMKLAPLYLRLQSVSQMKRERGGKEFPFLSYMFYTALLSFSPSLSLCVCDYVLNLKSVNLKQLIELRCLSQYQAQAQPQSQPQSRSQSRLQSPLQLLLRCYLFVSFCSLFPVCTVADSAWRLNH